MHRSSLMFAAVVAAAVCVAGPPARASAATVQTEGDRTIFRAAPGETNAVTVTTTFGAITIRDASAPLFVGPGCSRPNNGDTVICRGASVLLDLGDRDDTATSAVRAEFRGGPGADRLVGSPFADVMTGGTGTDTASYATRTQHVFVDLDGVADDGEAGEGDLVAADVEAIVGGAGPDTLVGNAQNNVLSGGPGRDQLFGQAGFDTLDGGTGPDLLNGGADIDTLTYVARVAPVTVTLGDGAANDGEAGEGDDPAAIEKVVGGTRADVLRGDAGANVLEGGEGDDVLVGLDGDDILRGGAGRDQLNGNIGSDTLDGGLGADQLFGGTGVGTDRVIYPRLAGVRVTLDDVANDGESGEGDDVRSDNEQVEGGLASDTLVGSARGETLLGGLGDDTLDGGGGVDILDGGAGEDLLRARDGLADRVLCGIGTRDVALVDAGIDTVAACEDVA